MLESAFFDDDGASIALAAPLALGWQPDAQTFRSVPQICAFSDDAAVTVGLKFYIYTHFVILLSQRARPSETVLIGWGKTVNEITPEERQKAKVKRQKQ